jgi:hypothetical protein
MCVAAGPPFPFTVVRVCRWSAFRRRAYLPLVGPSPLCVVPPGVFCTVVTVSPFVRYIVVRGVPARSRQQEFGCIVVDGIEYTTVVGCITFYIYVFMFILLLLLLLLFRATDLMSNVLNYDELLYIYFGLITNFVINI